MAAISFPTSTLPTIRLPRPSSAVYLRRRLFVAALVLAALVAVGLLLGALGGGPLTASEAGSPDVLTVSLETVSASTHVVVPGDTLWSIARQLQPEGDVRPLVDALAAVRDGRPLQVGERIRLP